MDQRADAGDEQREEDGQLVDEQAGGDLPGADRDPVEEDDADGTLVRSGQQLLREEAGGDAEGEQDGCDGDPVADAVEDAAEQQQDGSAHGRHGDHQPRHREHAVGGDGRQGFQGGHAIAPLTASAGSPRPPRWSDGCDRW